MLTLMRSVLDDDVHSHKGALLNRIQQCFAVKKGHDGLLDLARETFQRLSEEIHALLPTYQEQHNLQTLRVTLIHMTYCTVSLMYVRVSVSV
jgi:hypothetical protein